MMTIYNNIKKILLSITAVFSLLLLTVSSGSAVDLPQFSDLDSVPEVDKADQRQQESFSIVLNPRKEAVLSAEVDSTVKQIVREFGQSFKKGDTLVRFNSVYFRLKLSQANAVYEQKQKAFTAVSDLYKNRSRSSIDLEEARAEQSIAKVNVDLANYDLTRCTIKAPYNGRVEHLAVDENEWVAEGDPLIRIVNDTTLLARTLVPAGALASFAIGSPVKIELTGGNIVSGNVSHIGAVMDSASQTFEVKIEIPNPDGKLRCGMTGKILSPAADKGQN